MLRLALLGSLLLTAVPGLAIDEPRRSVAALRQAAEAGDVDAQIELGLHLRFGDGVERDEAKGLEWVRKAADRGSAGGQFWLADAYQWGAGVAKDLVEAARWYRRAAEQGDASAQHSLGEMYAGQLDWEHESALGLPRDDAEAVRWFRLAAEQGDAAGQYALASMIAAGRGAAKDMDEAHRWYHRSAEQGFTVAQSDLGEAYEHGRGVEVDLVCAYFWYAMAGRDGWELAEGQRDLLGARLSPDQLALARRLVRASHPETTPLRRPMCPTEKLSMKLTDAGLTEVLAVLEDLSGLDVVGAEPAIAAKKPVAVEVDAVSWEVVLTKVLEAQGYRWVREGETIRVLPATERP